MSIPRDPSTGPREPRGRLAIGLLLLGLLAGCGGGARKGAAGDESFERVRKAGTLLWGADVVAGVPYVYEDPHHPGQYTGFEMDIAQGIASRLGVKLELTIRAWDTLVPELQRGSFDLAMNGIEDTPERRHIVLFSHPYYVYSQQLTVRKGTSGGTRLADLEGKRVATLSGTAAEDILRGTPAVRAVVHPEIVYSYRDLERGKVDAVLLDKPIAVAYGASNPRLQNVGESFAEGRYVIVLRREDAALCQAVDQALDQMKASGELGKILEKYGLMDAHQRQIGTR